MTTASATPRRRIWPTLARLDLDRLALPAFALAAAASLALLVHLTRSTSFWADDWNWIEFRRGDTVDTFLAPYGGHLSLVPIAVYRLLFATFGLGSYVPYRVLAICLSVLVAALLFAYARRRCTPVVALCISAPMLFLGAGADQTLWGFQVPWLLVSGTAIAALMLLERDDRRCDAVVCALLLVALCSTSLAIAVAIGVAVDIVCTRRRARDLWIVALPAAFYLAWIAYYHPGRLAASEITALPLNLAQAGAAALSGLAGLSGVTPLGQTGTSLSYGLPLLAVAVALVACTRARRQINGRAIALVAMAVAFVASVTVARIGPVSVLSSRYVYEYCLLAALLIAELARGARLTRPLQWALLSVTALAVISNVGELRTFGSFLREQGKQTDGALAALDLDRATVAPQTTARIGFYQLVRISARRYFDAARALGSPAFTVSQLRRSDATAQSAADSQFLADRTVTLAGAPAATVSTGPAPTLGAVTGGVALSGAGCVRLLPSAALAPGQTGTVTVTIPAASAASAAALTVTVTAAGAPASVAFARFSPAFTPLGTVAAGATAVVRVRRDATAQPWRLQLESVAPVRVCAARLH